jgi:hypothetical protein
LIGADLAGAGGLDFPDLVIFSCLMNTDAVDDNGSARRGRKVIGLTLVVEGISWISESENKLPSRLSPSTELLSSEFQISSAQEVNVSAAAGVEANSVIELRQSIFEMNFWIILCTIGADVAESRSVGGVWDWWWS